MSKKLIGHFYYKKTPSGNLIGEFSNGYNNKVQTESSDSIKNPTSFQGTFKATWFDNNSNFLELKIDFKPGTYEKIFLLEWSDINGKALFWGEGFIVDDMLIGSYRDFLNN